MSDSRLLHLGSLLDSKNSIVRFEAARAFGRYSLCDEKVVEVLLKYLVAQSWEARIAAADAVNSVVVNTEYGNPKTVSSEISQELKGFVTDIVINTFKPLLSIDRQAIGSAKKLTTRQQRQQIDQHLDLQSATGITSAGFLNDSEVLPGDESNLSPCEKGEDLKIDVPFQEDGVHNAADESVALQHFVHRLLSLLADQNWNFRHGAATALARILASCYKFLLTSCIEDCTVRLLQILVLDQFNDFVSGRSATAPVREACSQALGFVLHHSDEARKTLVLNHVMNMLAVKGEQMWQCRQSALLVLKYFFAVVPSLPTFEKCFQLVIDSMNDPVDEVVSCAVTAMSSFLSNDSLDDSRSRYVISVMKSVWRLLFVEAKKDQIRTGFDGLVIDLMSIIETWLKVDTEAALNREEIMVISNMLDPLFPTRNSKVILLLTQCLGRGEKVLTNQDTFQILKALYRVILFSAPTDDLTLLESCYIVTLHLTERYRAEIQSETQLHQTIGLWISCLVLDHRNALIDVFALSVDGPSSTEQNERMCSEEMRFLGDKEKDAVYMTRKILAAKFLAAVIVVVYESGMESSGQPISLALQLFFVPCLTSTSLYQGLGAACIVNEWAALHKAAFSRGQQMEPPIALIPYIDSYLRTSKVYDETTQCIQHLTDSCNEFIEYCGVRGLDKTTLDVSETSSVEDISKVAYEKCRALLSSEKQLEALDARYRLLVDWMESTKLMVKANSVRIYGFLSSALFMFGFAPEKLTPMVRPIVECIQIEQNDMVAAEILKGSVPQMIAFSWQRNPRPYVKVIAKAVDVFSSCSSRIPKPSDWEASHNESSIISLEFKEKLDFSAASKNAEMMLLVCSSFSVDQLPEFYTHFQLDGCDEKMILLQRLELHNCLWSRVGSCLSDDSTERIFKLLADKNPALRYAAAKALATFASSRLGDTVSRILFRLTSMLNDLKTHSVRRGAVEAIYRISLLENSLSGVVSLLAPAVFPRLSDTLPEVRTLAGEAFRNLVPLLAFEDISQSVPELSDELNTKRRDNVDFISVLSCPSALPLVQTDSIKGLLEDVKLRHYQKEGITWMRFLRRFGLNGILADDMGLGKTLQTLCTIALSLDNDSPTSEVSIVVCPRTLVDHWCHEWRRFFPHRPPARKGDVGCSWAGCQLVVTAYEDLKSNPRLLKTVWNYAVLDEGHIMRNPKTAIWRAASEIRATSRLILSGTPVQNSPSDLWALFAWLMPGYLGDEKQFRAQYLKSILRCRSPKASEKDVKGGNEAVAKLHKLILPFVLRRLKSEVLKELPEKNVQDYECQLSDDQREIYSFLVDKCTTNRDRLESGTGISPLHALISLRKLVDHPILTIDILERLKAPSELITKARNAESGKLAALGQLLNECGIGRAQEKLEDEDEDLLNTTVLEMPHRALIFCQWKSSVHLVTNSLDSGDFGSKVPYVILDGSVPVSERQAVVDRFNTDHSIDVLVLTTHIGGVGLNLTGADVVIFLDHDWNPMKDLQAIDRAHRLGQKRKVNVYRLITQGTVEEKVMSLHKFKQNTADALIGADNRSLQSMATEELMNMFTLDGSECKASEPKAKKKPRDITNPTDEQWNLGELWDESQYEQQFDVKSFISAAHR